MVFILSFLVQKLPVVLHFQSTSANAFDFAIVALGQRFLEVGGLIYQLLLLVRVLRTKRVLAQLRIVGLGRRRRVSLLLRTLLLPPFHFIVGGGRDANEP